jgi:hypothetical protein
MTPVNTERNQSRGYRGPAMIGGPAGRECPGSRSAGLPRPGGTIKRSQTPCDRLPLRRCEKMDAKVNHPAGAACPPCPLARPGRATARDAPSARSASGPEGPTPLRGNGPYILFSDRVAETASGSAVAARIRRATFSERSLGKCLES